MMTLSTIEQRELIDILLDYINGAPLQETDARIQSACDEHQKNANELYQTLAVSAHTRQQLLQALHIANDTPYARQDNLFELLAQLDDDGSAHNHLAYFLKRINVIQCSFYWEKRVPLLASISGGILGLFIADTLTPTLQPILRLGTQLVNYLTQHAPLLGIIYTAMTWLYSAYQLFYYGFSQLEHKLTKLGFQLLSASFTILGYCLSMFAACIATPTVGLLSIAAALVSVIDSYMHYLHIIAKPLHSITNNSNAIRYAMEKKLASETIAVNLIAGALGVVIVGLWCFMPPSLLLSISCVTAMILTNVITSHALSRITYTCAEELQESLRKNNHRFFQYHDKTKADDKSSLAAQPAPAMAP